MSIHTYTAQGSLTNPVSDYDAARKYLRDDDMTQYVDGELKSIVHDISWDLVDEGSWKVVVITSRLLTDEESKELSSWISCQNSDGLGEGFEQQPFAEHTEYVYDEDEDGDDEEFSMSSFDWQTNDCPLTLVK